VGAAEDLSVGFHAVPNNPAGAVRANRRQRMDSALEAIEGVVLPANDYFKRFVIFVFADFACSHTQIFCALYARFKFQKRSQLLIHRHSQLPPQCKK